MNKQALFAATLAASLLLPGMALAGKSEANIALASAETSVSAAEDGGAAGTAELQLARGELGQAQRACASRQWRECERVARRAHADARLAAARSRQAQAETAVAELQAAVDALRNELERRGG